MRTLVDIPEDDVRWLDGQAEAAGKSRAALVREAVSAYRAEQVKLGDADDLAQRNAALDAGFGLWARHGVAYDPHDYDRRRRAEWTRPWDDDYEDVRTESPDLFDAEDDRQRQIYLDMVDGRYPDVKRSRAK